MATKNDTGEQRGSPNVRTGFFRGTVFGEKALQYSVIDGEAIFEGDIVLGPADTMDQLADARRGGQPLADVGLAPQGVAITGQAFRWPNALVPFDIDATLPNQQRVRDAIAHWEQNTTLRFVERTAANAAQHPNWVTFRPGNGCSAMVGMRGGQQFVTLGNGCSTGSTIHEIGHVIGLWHEQSREDRDQFVTIQWQNIEAGREHNFNQHVTDGDDIGAYDYGSIMHYPRNAFTVNGQDTIVPVDPAAQIGQRNGLSAGDIAAARALYPPPKTIAKDTKDRKDLILDTKQRKDQKDVKDRKDTKDRKERLKEIGKEALKESKEGKDAKDFKDRKDRFEFKPFERLPVPSFDAGQAAHGAVDERLTAIEQTLGQLEHFISASMRPDLELSPLSHEGDVAGADPNLAMELKEQADRAKLVKDAKDTSDTFLR